MHLASYICIVSPYPKSGVYLDGWMSRIKTIDLVFGEFPRCYIDFQTWFPAESDPELVHGDDDVVAYRINPFSDKHLAFACTLLEKSCFVYVHTLHQCEYMLDLLDPEKTIVDIHGIVPEEEAMMGDPAKAMFFGKIEEQILVKARRCVVVTKAMADHYARKYRHVALPEFIHVPVFDYGSLNDPTDKIEAALDRRSLLPRFKAIYAGGAQIWQKSDEMIRIMSLSSNVLDHEIYTHNIPEFRDMLTRAGLDPTTLKGNSSKERLIELYRGSSFGFALRDDNIVNRVACPTKICDYCANMVIPIIDFAEIGDFTSYGYQFVTADDVVAGFLPDRDSQRWMIKQNLLAMEMMLDDFISGIQKVVASVSARVG